MCPATYPHATHYSMLSSNIYLVVGIFHEFVQVFCLDHDSIEIGVGQSNGLVDFVGVGKSNVGLEFYSSFANDKILAIGCGHLLGSPQ